MKKLKVLEKRLQTYYLQRDKNMEFWNSRYRGEKGEFIEFSLSLFSFALCVNFQTFSYFTREPSVLQRVDIYDWQLPDL